MLALLARTPAESPKATDAPSAPNGGAAAEAPLPARKPAYTASTSADTIIAAEQAYHAGYP